MVPGTQQTSTHTCCMKEGMLVHTGRATTIRGGEKAAEACGAPALGAVPPPARNQPPPGQLLPGELHKQSQCQAVQEALPPKPVWEEAWGPCQGVIRRGVGWVRGRTWTIFTNSLPKRPHSCSHESEARGRESRQDAEAPGAAVLGRSGRQVRDPGIHPASPGRITGAPGWQATESRGSLPVKAHEGPVWLQSLLPAQALPPSERGLSTLSHRELRAGRNNFCKTRS